MPKPKAVRRSVADNHTLPRTLTNRLTAVNPSGTATSIMNITLVKTDIFTDVKCLCIYGLLKDAFSSSD